MVKNHMKRLAMPRTWKLDRKSLNFVIRPKAGKDFAFALPLGTVLKELLHLCANNREVKAILTQKKVSVNGQVQQDMHFPVGLFDVLTIQGAPKQYRLVFDAKGYLACAEATEPSKMLFKVTGKTTLKGGKVQLNCFNGRNLLVDKDTYRIGDVIVTKDGKVSAHLKLEPNMKCILTSGKHGGTIGTIQNIAGNIVTIKTENGTFDTLKAYAYVIGKDTPEIRVTM